MARKLRALSSLSFPFPSHSPFPFLSSACALAHSTHGSRSTNRPSSRIPHGPSPGSFYGYRFTFSTTSRAGTCLIGSKCLDICALGSIFEICSLPCPNCLRRRVHRMRLPHSCHNLCALMCTVPVLMVQQPDGCVIGGLSLVNPVRSRICGC